MPRSAHQCILRQLHKKRGCSIAKLRRLVPDCPRNALARLLREWRKRRRRRQRRGLCRLSWNEPGAVWAMDGTKLDVPVLGKGHRALVVADLGARATIACCPIWQECADETIACLEALIAAYGAPLVLKVDNGPGFIAAAFQRLCDHYGILLLYSPARRPPFNGAIEARVRWAKAAVYAAAQAHGRRGYVLEEDLGAALRGLGRVKRVPDKLRAEFSRTFERTLRAVRNDPRLVPRGKTRHARRASLQRVAAQRALEECHILTIRRPEFRQWLPPPEQG